MTPAEREPIRTCVGCRAREPKGSMVRIVAGLDEGPRVDRSGVAGGRGAYVHRVRSCLDAARHAGALPRALRVDVSTDEVGRLMDEIERIGAA